MTITSINHNPKNDSRYARRRSIWKGTSNQLQHAVATLRTTRGVQVYEYCDKTGKAVEGFERAWDVQFRVSRRPPRKNEILGQWVYTRISNKLLAAVPGNLQADFRLLWDDFLVIVANRMGKWWGLEMSGYHDSRGLKYTGKSLIMFAPGPAGFDLIASKYGYGDGTGNHHFYQWQSRLTEFWGTVSVDNYDTEESGVGT